MKRMKRASIVLLAVALVVSLTMVIPASAQRESSDVEVMNSEFVLATMASTGQIEEVQVFNWLSLDGNGAVNVKKEKTFEDIGGFQGVKGFAKPRVEGDYIVWPEIKVDGPKNVIANTVLSEPSVEEARTRIPLDVRFKYWFDGEPVTDLETITGKSGRFKVELTLTNTSKEKTELEYVDPATGEKVSEEVETYLPLVILPYDWYFDNSIFFNLEADPTGTVIWMPDFYNIGWSIPLFPPATEESHTIWVEADAKDFAMPPLTLAAVFHFPHTNQKDITATLAPFVKLFYEGMVTVNEGIGSPSTDASLLYGINAIFGGLEQLGAGLPEAPEAITGKLIPGLNSAIAGIGSEAADGTLLYAVQAVQGGLQGMTAGIGAPGSDPSLLYAMAQMAAGLEQTKAGIGTSTTDETLLFAVNKIQGGLGEIAAGIGSDADDGTLLYAVNAVQGGLNGILSGVQDLIAAIGDTATAGTLLNGLAQILGGAQLLSEALGEAGEAGTVIDGLTGMATGLGATIPGLTGIKNSLSPGGGPTTLYDYTLNVVKPLTDSSDPSIWPNLQAMMDAYAAGLGTAVTGLTGMQSGLDNDIIPGLTMIKTLTDAQMVPGIQQMIGGVSGLMLPGLQAITTGIGSPTTDGTLLYAMAAMQAGLGKMKDEAIGDASTDGTLLYGMAALQGGLMQIANGIGSQADDGTLLYAVQAVEEGLNTMKAGIGDAGVSDTLLFAMAAIQGGLHTLKSGLRSGDPNDPALVEGLLQVTAGIDKAVAGIGSPTADGTLLYAADQVSGGLSRLKDEGTTKLEEGLLAVLTQFSMTGAELEAIAQRGEEFDHFLGRADGAENNVRFILQSKPTYNYTAGSSTSWVVAIVLSVIIAIALVAGGILLSRRSTA